MCDRAASAQIVDEIFVAHPSWNRTPYRLSFNGKSGIDHTSPSSWLGDVIVGGVDLHSSWLCGQSQAATVLRQAGVPFQFDPAALLTESPSIDLVRPSGSYPGIQLDDIKPDFDPISLIELAKVIPVPALGLSRSSSDSANNSSNSLSDSVDTETDIEQLLEADPEDSLPERPKRGWLQVKGAWVHLKSAIRHLLGAGGGTRSTDRLRRFCGFTRYL